MSREDPGGAQRQRSPKQRLDGITLMSGSATFATGGVSLDLTIDANGGSFDGTQNFAVTTAVDPPPNVPVTYSDPQTGNQDVDNSTSPPITHLKANNLHAPVTNKEYKFKLDFQVWNATTSKWENATALYASVAKAPASGPKTVHFS